MATVEKTYLVQDADKKSHAKGTDTVFPGTLNGLLDALEAARYRSAAGSPKALIIVQGKQRQTIRRFEGGREVWSASSAEIRHEVRKEAEE
jgi:hypothetical protein